MRAAGSAGGSGRKESMQYAAGSQVHCPDAKVEYDSEKVGGERYSSIH